MKRREKCYATSSPRAEKMKKNEKKK